jgi:hypothetical protein
VTLRPAEVHPEQHLRPVGRLGSAGAGTDGEQRRPVVIVAREQQGGSLPLEVRGQEIGILGQLRGELRIARFVDELEERLEFLRPGQDALPEQNLILKTVSLTQNPLGLPPVFPESGVERQGLEFRDPVLLRGKVKDAPRSSESAPRGPGPQPRPSGPDPEVLEQDRPELNQPQG